MRLCEANGKDFEGKYLCSDCNDRNLDIANGAKIGEMGPMRKICGSLQSVHNNDIGALQIPA